MKGDLWPIRYIQASVAVKIFPRIAVLDIAGLLFGFSVYMGMLGQVENGEKIDVKKLFFSALKTPAFIASILGIIAGLSKVILAVLDSPFGCVYQSVENILTTSVTAIILLVVGYSMELNAKIIKAMHCHDHLTCIASGSDDCRSSCCCTLSGR